MSDGLANLRIALKIARLALTRGPRVYRRAFLAEEERKWNEICHLDHLAIDAAIAAKAKLRKRRAAGPGKSPQSKSRTR
jgi:hypothetical protein